MLRNLPAQRLRFLFLAGILAPALMVLAGAGIAYLHSRTWLPLGRWPTLTALGWGGLTAVASLSLVTLLFKTSKRLEQALRDSSVRVGLDMIRSVGYPVTFVVVIASGLGEEALFRWGLQPVIGVVPAALLFGFSHGGWRRGMWAYVVAAAISGTLFGVMYVVSKDLWVPVIAHAAHNVLSTVLLGKKVDVSWAGWYPRVRLVPDEAEFGLEATESEPVFEEAREAAPDDAVDESVPAEGDGQADGAGDGDSHPRTSE